MSEFIPLSLLAGRLRDATGGSVPGYRSLYGKVLDGALPAVMVNGRWHVREDDLPQIAASLKLPAISSGCQLAHEAA